MSDTILNIISALTELNENDPPCKKTLQKIVYLIEEKGSDLGYTYGIHFYGPYSSDLDYDIQKLSAERQIDIEYQEYGHKLRIANPPGEGIKDKTAQYVIKVFGKQTASDLELLATTLFVARELNRIDKAAITDGVRKIKGAKYSEPQIDYAIDTLRAQNYF